MMMMRCRRRGAAIPRGGRLHVRGAGAGPGQALAAAEGARAGQGRPCRRSQEAQTRRVRRSRARARDHEYKKDYINGVSLQKSLRRFISLRRFFYFLPSDFRRPCHAYLKISSSPVITNWYLRTFISTLYAYPGAPVAIIFMHTAVVPGTR